MNFTLISICSFALLLIIIPISSIPLNVSEKSIEEVANKLEYPTNRDGVVAVMNNYTDRVFVNIDNLIVNVGQDPYNLPDKHQGFNYAPAFGSLDLTNGYLKGLSTMHRGGDTVVSYDPNGSNVVSIVVPITFDALSLMYDYKARFLLFTSYGCLEGKITNLRVEISVDFDFNRYQASLNYFNVKNSGHIDLHFSGNILTDWMLNVVGNVVTAFFKRVILLIMETVIRNPIQMIIDSINAVLGTVLH